MFFNAEYLRTSGLIKPKPRFNYPFSSVRPPHTHKPRDDDRSEAIRFRNRELCTSHFLRRTKYYRLRPGF